MQISSQPAVQFAHLPVACVLVDGNGVLQAANILAQEHLNISEKRLRKKALTDLLGPKNEVDSTLKRAAEGMIVSADIYYTLQGHKPYSLHFSRQDDGCISVVMIAEGNRLEAESQSRRHEMAEAISRIALERAHEIKNPLAALRGVTQLLSEQVQGKQLMMVKQMLSEIDRIKERVDGFLQVGPRANVAMASVNIHALLDDVSRNHQGVMVERAYDPSIPELQGHESRLRQAFENLWQNALEAGSKHVVWETRIAHGITLFEHRGLVLQVKIISDGAKIPDEIQSKLFEPYVTAKARGNGLGLSIVQQVVQEHGGKVTVKSEGVRTVFSIYLPLKG